VAQLQAIRLEGARVDLPPDSVAVLASD